ncbi:MAG: LysM domain-containing protein, partial [Nitrospinales bacterium]
INKMRRNQSIQISKKIKVPFTRTTPSKFEEKRQEYHKAIQEDFFNNYRVEKTLVKKVRKGETLWEICNEIYFIPLWLLSTYNPEKDIHSLSVGETIVIPVITPIKNQDA